MLRGNEKMAVYLDKRGFGGDLDRRRGAVFMGSSWDHSGRGYRGDVGRAVFAVSIDKIPL